MSMELRAGGTLGRYELLVRIGRGGMASVWVARERTARSERLVALKAMLPELAEQANFRSMFLEEGQIVRSIDHANVVRVFEVSEDSGVLYMAMEWVEGDSLRAIIQEAKKRRPIPPEMAVRIIADTAGGLHAAHELRGWDGELRGIVHCDVSPHNILVGMQGESKLVDFGVASAVEQLRTHEPADRVAGKYGYMSPEQVNAERVDRRSDVFSLGIVLFELTTGERLFKGDNPAHTLELVKRAHVPRPTKIVSDYPARLEQIVLRALDIDVERRYQTAEDLRLALERFLVDERILVSRASVAQLLKRVVGARIDKRRQLIGAVLRSLDGELRPELPAGSAGWHAAPSEVPQDSSVSVASMTDRSSVRPGYTAITSTDSIEEIEPERSRWGMLLGGVVVLAAAAGGYFLFQQQRQPSSGVEAPQAAAPAAATQTTARPSGASTPATDQPSGVSIDSLPLAAEAEPGRPRPAQRAPARAAAPASKATSPEAVKLEAEQAAAAEAAPPPEVEAENPYRQEQADEPEEPPKPSGPAGPLNPGAAIAALGKAASNTRSCSSDDGPSGSGQASVTFQPDGSVSNVSVSAPFSGTSVGRCVAGAFKRVRIQPFTGSSVTLSRSFVVPE